MFKVLFSEEGAEGINLFTKRYEECFVSLFHDSGIWSENVIIDKYRFAAKELNHCFVDEIVQRLKGDTVLGRKKRALWFEVGFHIDHRFMSVCYTENKKEKQRTVEWTSVNQK